MYMNFTVRNSILQRVFISQNSKKRAKQKNKSGHSEMR